MERPSAPSPSAAANRGGIRPASPKKANRRPLFLALLLGAVATVLIIAYLSRQGSSGVAEAVATSAVVVATQDIAPGQKIAESMVELKVLPSTSVAPNTATAKNQVVGKTLRYPVATGEQLSNLRLVGGVKGQGLSFQVPEGLRAFTIPVNVNNTPAALIAPGDFVDVLASGPIRALRLAPQLATAGTQNSDEGRKVTVTLIQNVQVLAVQREFVENAAPRDPAVRGKLPQKENVSHVTLALTPDQVQLLWEASTEGGKITLALRPFGDAQIVALEPITDPRAQAQSLPVLQGQRPSGDAKTGDAKAKPLDPITGPRARGLSFQIPHGLRAFTIPVKVTDTPAALIAPGDFVDVLASGPLRAFRLAPQLAAAGTQSSGQDNRATVTLFQNVQVLAVQREYVENEDPYDPAVRGAPPQKENVSHVTLALTPEQVQILWLASTEEGKITLALRPFGDAETKPLDPITEPKAQGLSYQIPDSLRAFTIPVNVTNTPAALIAPGDFVDVLVSGPMQTLRLARHLANAWGENSNEDRKVTATLFQNVQVLTVQREYLETAVNAMALPSAPSSPLSTYPHDPAVRGALSQKENVNYVTLALTPEQGQLLLVVSNEGKITLALRRFGDARIVAVNPITEPRPEGLSYQIHQGMRAFTIPVEVTNSPASLVAPGDFIDVLATKDIFIVLPSGAEKIVGKEVETLIQNVRVLAVRREYLNKAFPQDPPVRGAPAKNEDVTYLTLELMPPDAQRLAAYRGPVTVTLRPVGDDKLPVLNPITIETARAK